MTAAGLDDPERLRRHWCTAAAMTAWSSLAHSVLMRCMRTYRDQSCMFCIPCLAVFPTHFSQLDLNTANLEAIVEAEWILAFTTFLLLTSQYVVSCKYWWNVLQFFSHMDCQDDSCQKLLKVVWICQSYGQNTVGPFFPDTVYISPNHGPYCRTICVSLMPFLWVVSDIILTATSNSLRTSMILSPADVIYYSVM